MESMKAVRVHEYGGPEVLKYEDAPRPQAGPGEVLIKVHASSVNPVDWKVRAGHLKQMLNHKMPMIPGWDVSGVIEAVGSGVTRLKRGDEVYSRPDLSRDGAYAEFVTVKESEVALKPKSIDHATAAAIPLAALTAWQALYDAAKLSSGQTLLIHGAAGGVGTFAVQLAKMRGARVIATASKKNHDFLRSLGADEVIDYNTTKFEEVVHGVDAVLDTITGETMERSWKTLKKGGILVSILDPPSPEKAAAHGVRCHHTFVQPNVEQLNEIAKLVDAGKLKIIIEKSFPLAEARAAQESNATGHTRGKIVLRVI
ncbi:MAG TPA: NADP-dependent oxidoreductase [Candidatus Acidoferrales bacterium]|nr:NADP-dependent oxidoreductase [Candidatus Acidoferrales bacterium]